MKRWPAARCRLTTDEHGQTRTTIKKPYLEDLLGSKAPRRKGEPGYGLGVDIERTELGPSYGHDGWFPGYRTKMAYFADHKIAVAIQVNTDEEVDTSRCALSLARALTAKPSLGKNRRSGKKTDVLKSGPGETS